MLYVRTGQLKPPCANLCLVECGEGERKEDREREIERWKEREGREGEDFKIISSFPPV